MMGRARSAAYAMLAAAMTLIAAGSSEARWVPTEGGSLPESCAQVLRWTPERSDATGSAEAVWNGAYLEGIDALSEEDFQRAEERFCAALRAALTFGPRDIRFAETLDELGLVSYMAGDFERAEAMQGAAVAEMLLAEGPSQPRLAEATEQNCASSVTTYLVRLGWIYEQEGRAREIEALKSDPHRILGLGYLPRERIEGRLDRLISQYLLAERFDAANWLAELKESSR